MSGSSVSLAQTLALPASGTVRSQPFGVHGRHLSIHADWTGTPTGIIALQYSMDGGANWRAISRAAVEFISNGNAQPAGSASSGDWSFLNVPGGSWSLLYTATSGTGSLVFNYSWNK